MSTRTIEKTSNDSGNNYCKMPDGTLVCWGTITIPAGVGNSTITYSVSFVNNDYILLCTPDITTSTSGVYSSGLFSSEKLLNNPGKQGRVHRQVGTVNYSSYVYWIAIGRWK